MYKMIILMTIWDKGLKWRVVGGWGEQRIRGDCLRLWGKYIKRQIEASCFMTHLKIIIEEIVEGVWKERRCDSVGFKRLGRSGRCGRGQDTGQPGFPKLMMCVMPCGNLLLSKWILKFNVVSLLCSAFWFCHVTILAMLKTIYSRVKTV